MDYRIEIGVHNSGRRAMPKRRFSRVFSKAAMALALQNWHL
jgi:hypothetical protein